MSAAVALHPERIGKYRIDSVLGEGAMGVVYKAHDTVLERDVAIKVVRTELLADKDRSDYLARFKREAQAAARFHHPNIVAVYDFADYENAPYIAMEYVLGRPLVDVFRQHGRFSPKQAELVVSQMLSALGCVHGFGIVHRDIKPSNVIVLAGGVVKLADFGVARMNTSELTMDGSMVGTAGYMSPEQYKGETVDPRSDLFSVGVMLFELLAGEKPFVGGSFAEVLYKTVYEPHRDITAFAPEVSPALNAVIGRALAKTTAERFQSADEFAAALKQALGQPVSAPATVPAAAHSAPPVAPAITPPATMAGVSSLFSPERLEVAERALVVHVGPIAKVLVKKAAAQSSSLEDFYDRLAANLPREAEKAAFFSAIRRG